MPGAVPTRVWALPVRLAHWSLAALVLVNFFNDADQTHRYLGYAAAAIVLLRLLGGRLVPPNNPARLRLPATAECLGHFRQMREGRVPSPAGHNALGNAMSLLIWALVLLLGLSGWMSQWDVFWGEDWIELLHESLSRALQACVVLHLLGVLISSVLERQNLALGMITGRKHVDADAPRH